MDSGVATFKIQNVPGVPDHILADILTVPYNNLFAVEEAIAQHKNNEIAALILEPVAGNMGCIPPHEDFLQGVRLICNKEGIILIFDEVMTDFRFASDGAQELYNVYADLVTFG